MSKLALLEAIDRAIDAEEKAHAFYLEAAEKTRDSGGAAMFRELAGFEDHHRSRLEALKASLKATGTWLEYEGRALSKAPAAEAGGRAAVGSTADALEALRIAIGAEETAAAEYAALADAAQDDAGHRMFTRLAQEESMHRKLLDEQFCALSQGGTWFWND